MGTNTHWKITGADAHLVQVYSDLASTHIWYTFTLGILWHFMQKNNGPRYTLGTHSNLVYKNNSHRYHTENNRHRYTLGAGTTYLTVSQHPLIFVCMLATNYLWPYWQHKVHRLWLTNDQWAQCMGAINPCQSGLTHCMWGSFSCSPPMVHGQF